MSQASTWGVARNSGEADESEDVWATRADESLDATLSAHKGATRPTYAVEGTRWINDTATPWVVYEFDGTDDIEKYRIDPSANTIRHRWYKGADIASATALVLGGDGNYFDVTGTAAITSIGTIGIGSVIRLHFDGALTLTHDATDLVLPGAADILTAAGDEAEFIEYASGDWRCVNYQKASGFGLVNTSGGPTIAAAVGSNALTISLKSTDGSDPSSSNPVALTFRDATLTNGAETSVDVTAATSIVISSGSTLDTVNNVPFRFWVVAINDGGTIRLAAINCSGAGFLRSLNEWGVISASAEGGAGGADTGAVFYAGSAVTSKAMTVLGYVEYSSGLTTAGTYGTAPSVVQSHRPNMPLPGAVLQTVEGTHGTTVSTSSATYVTTNLTKSIVPLSACSLMGISAVGAMTIGNSGTVSYATIAKDGTSIGKVVSPTTASGGLTRWPLTLEAMDVAGGTSSIAYSVMMKQSGSGLTYWNGAGDADEGSTITIVERMG